MIVYKLEIAFELALCDSICNRKSPSAESQSVHPQSNLIDNPIKMQDICEEIELDYGPFKNRLNVETGVPNDTSKYLPSIKEEGENDDQIGEFVATPTRTLSSPKTTERFTRKVRINLNDTNLLEAQACCSDPLRNCLQGVDSLDAFELNRHTTQSTFEANIKLTSTIKEITIVLLNKFDWMSDRYTTLGSLEIDMIETTLSSLRTLILKNVLYLPEDFSFLHKDRDSITYILRNQEEYKTACDLINWDGLKEDKGSIFIQSSAPKLKIGIVECTGAGVCLGSIICNRDDILSNLRQVIDTHFKQLTSIIDEGGNLYARLKNFIFLDERFWPITPQQELSIAVHSIIGKNQTIAIKSGSLADTMAYVGREKLHFSLADGIDTKCDTLLEVSNNQKSNHTKQSSNSPLILGSKNTLKERRNWKFKDLSFKNISFDVGSLKLSIDGEQSRQMRKAKKEYRRGTKTMKEDQKKTFDNNRKINKQVMISYVRREAAVHALYLKSALERLGLTVYLDVHEIKSGSDWQDSLNDAISGCLVFVPLVTSSYGQTLWSNREIKLADVLKKHIIPVNFGQSWPPACLAIQFATTQYICWKPNDDCILGDDASKINHWPKECILEVAVLIKNNLRIAESSSLGTNNLEDSSTECVIDYAGSKGHSFLPDLVETMNQDRTRRVAISHHQNDGLVANKIKDVLQQNHYQVWLANCNSTKGTAMPMTKCNSSGYSAESSHFLDSYESSNKNYLVHERYRQSCSTLYGSCSTLNGCWKLDSNHYEDFLENIAECSLVVLIGSREYFESSMSMIHVFYCESRKPIILIKVDNNNYYIPHDFKMLIKDIVTIEMDEELLGNGVADKNSCNGKYKLLLSCVESIIQTKANDGDNIKIGVCSDEDRLNELMLELKKSIPQRDNCVFLADGLEDIDLHRDPNIQQVCIHLGMELAKMRDLIIVTSGRTLGPANLIANTFVSCRTRDCVHEANGKQMDRNCICLYRITTNNDGNKLNFTSHCDNRETSQLRKQSSSIGMRHMNNELADGKSINLSKYLCFGINCIYTRALMLDSLFSLRFEHVSLINGLLFVTSVESLSQL